MICNNFTFKKLIKTLQSLKMKVLKAPSQTLSSELPGLDLKSIVLLSSLTRFFLDPNLALVEEDSAIGESVGLRGRFRRHGRDQLPEAFRPAGKLIDLRPWICLSEVWFVHVVLSEFQLCLERAYFTFQECSLLVELDLLFLKRVRIGRPFLVKCSLKFGVVFIEKFYLTIFSKHLLL